LSHECPAYILGNFNSVSSPPGLSRWPINAVVRDFVR
jgi:hypothetical protein